MAAGDRAERAAVARAGQGRPVGQGSRSVGPRDRRTGRSAPQRELHALRRRTARLAVVRCHGIACPRGRRRAGPRVRHDRRPRRPAAGRRPGDDQRPGQPRETAGASGPIAPDGSVRQRPVASGRAGVESLGVGARPRPGRRPPAVAQSPDAASRFARGPQGLPGRQGGRGPRGVRGGEDGVSRSRGGRSPGAIRGGDGPVRRLGSLAGRGDRVRAAAAADRAQGRSPAGRHGVSARRLDRQRASLQPAGSVPLVLGGDAGVDRLFRAGVRRLAEADVLARRGRAGRGAGLHALRPGAPRGDHRHGPGDQHVRDRVVRRRDGRPAGALVRPAPALVAGLGIRVAADRGADERGRARARKTRPAGRSLGSCCWRFARSWSASCSTAWRSARTVPRATEPC